ncbi:hypothetical protein L2E82_49927 [Cichorium intybus]|uniref:Uncharacterized protein n=1 Tax=Cichorium intybus TaxID=13427 RepID=A0ACB8Z182_CICIN|nr:hypothetical protein L2E82_49927 [Cichorium intybus]
MAQCGEGIRIPEVIYPGLQESTHDEKEIKYTTLDKQENDPIRVPFSTPDESVNGMEEDYMMEKNSNSVNIIAHDEDMMDQQHSMHVNVDEVTGMLADSAPLKQNSKVIGNVANTNGRTKEVNVKDPSVVADVNSGEFTYSSGEFR